MKKYKVIKQHYDIKVGTVVIDEGISDADTKMYGTEHRLVLIEGEVVPITYAVPLDKLEVCAE